MTFSHHYSLSALQDEVRQLVQQGIVSRHQAIYSLYEYIPAHAWTEVERELERSNFLLRDRIGDLISHEEWDND
jgi:Domain of unknown function (DUF4327)